MRTLADLISLIYFYHTIAHTNMCLDVLRGLLCWLQLFPQCCHKYPQRSHIVIPTAAPDILCDKGMGQYLANILGQQAQQLILNGRQTQFVLSQISASPSIIYFQFRFLYKGIIIKHNKTEPTYTKTSLFLCEKRRFFMARTEKGVVTTI